jgi:hypothetical protein
MYGDRVATFIPNLAHTKDKSVKLAYCSVFKAVKICWFSRCQTLYFFFYKHSSNAALFHTCSEVPVCEDVLCFIMPRALLWAQSQVEGSDIRHNGPLHGCVVWKLTLVHHTQSRTCRLIQHCYMQIAFRQCICIPGRHSDCGFVTPILCVNWNAGKARSLKCMHFFTKQNYFRCFCIQIFLNDSVCLPKLIEHKHNSTGRTIQNRIIWTRKFSDNDRFSFHWDSFIQVLLY